MIKRKKKFRNPDEFVTKWITQNEVITLAKAAKKRLEEEYINNNCPRKPGDIIGLKPDATPPYDQFEIDSIGLDITASNDPEEKKQGLYLIQYVYKGRFLGPDVMPKEGTLRIRPKTNETVAEPESTF